MSAAAGNPLLPHLEHKRILMLDGGLATELERRGRDLSGTLWSARLLRDDPEAIREVHEAFARAGADILITASYQATLGPLENGHLRRSVELARAGAAGRALLVAASVGPYGAARADGSEYAGDYGLDEAELLAWHAERFASLATVGADLLACETIPSFPEARALARLLESLPDVWAWFSFSCRDGTRICDGTPLRECIDFLEDVDRVAAVGVNCTAPGHVESLLRGIRTTRPIVAYPNSGEAYDRGTRRWTGRNDPRAFARLALRWRDAGARILGGCCRTGPEHIAAMRALLVGSAD